MTFVTLHMLVKTFKILIISVENLCVARNSNSHHHQILLSAWLKQMQHNHCAIKAILCWLSLPYTKTSYVKTRKGALSDLSTKPKFTNLFTTLMISISTPQQLET